MNQLPAAFQSLIAQLADPANVALVTQYKEQWESLPLDTRWSIVEAWLAAAKKDPEALLPGDDPTWATIGSAMLLGKAAKADPISGMVLGIRKGESIPALLTRFRDFASSHAGGKVLLYVALAVGAAGVIWYMTRKRAA